MSIFILDHGAVADGVTLAHRAINAAIEQCARRGGGTVSVPAGRYLCGTIHLRSGVLLELCAGARIVGTPDLTQYRPPEKAEGKPGSPWHRALVLAEEVSETGIVGAGVLDGDKVRDVRGEEGMRGPHTVVTSGSSNLVFDGITVVDSANYAFLALEGDDLEFRNLIVKGGWDGVHVRGIKGRDCRRIRIAHCDFQTGDDAVAGRYWDEFLISNCRINSSCNGVRLIGPATGLTVEGCFFHGPGFHPHITQNRHNMLAGILLQPGSWDATEGALDRVLLANNTMRDVQCALAVYLKPGNVGGALWVENLKAVGVYGAACSFESWAEEPLDRVSLRDVAVDYAAQAAVEAPVPDADLPHVGIRSLPGWGLYARRVRRLLLDNVRFSIARTDPRPCAAFHDVAGVERRSCDMPFVETP